VDRLLGEHGIQRDNPEGREQFEQRMEQRRREENDPEAVKALRRGWYLGGESFRKQSLLRMASQLREHHAGELHRASAEAKAQEILAQELKRLGLRQKDLASRRKNDPVKLQIAARLRRETTLTIKDIAARVCLGSSKSANAKLHRYMTEQESASKRKGSRNEARTAK
jgi:hypothetical protein